MPEKKERKPRPARIFIVSTDGGKTNQLVKATTKTDAMRAVVPKEIICRAARAEEVAVMMSTGAKLQEVAAKEAAKPDAAPAGKK